MSRIAVTLIKLYKRFVSPLMPPACKFQPTCSVYAVEAIEKYGMIRGGFMAVKRIIRCNPFSRGGYDPVP